MGRILYLSFPVGDAVAGGQKMIARHVETLRELGFDAHIWNRQAGQAQTWFDHRAPVEVDTPFRADDVLVAPSDAPTALRQLAHVEARVVVFCQGHFSFAALAFPSVDSYPPERAPAFIAVGHSVAGTVKRAFPLNQVELVRAFADERIFRPQQKQQIVACLPRKRPLEVRAIKAFLGKFHPRHATLRILELENLRETELAHMLGISSLFLSLSRLEGLGLTPLEAMASGCVVTGFNGVGGQDFATADNGFWAPEDDCVVAADLLAEAADLALTGGPALQRRLEAGHETARQWSYAAFRAELEDVWSRLAPETRTLGPRSS